MRKKERERLETAKTLLEEHSSTIYPTVYAELQSRFMLIKQSKNPLGSRVKLRNLIRDTKEQIRIIDKYIIDSHKSKKLCNSCKSADQLHIHHNGYLKDREVLTLCAKCHKKWHSKYGVGNLNRIVNWTLN